jgi:hypothetical protein
MIEENKFNLMIKEIRVEICTLINYDVFLIENHIYQIT